MKVFKRDRSPFYHYRFEVNGKPYRGTTKRKTKAEAERFMAVEYAKVMDQKQFGTKPTITLSEAFDRSINMVEGKTRTSYELSKRKWLGLDVFGRTGKWSLDGDMLLSDLTEGHLEDHIANRLGEGLKPNSINVEIRAIQRVHNACTKRFMVNHDLEFPKLKSFVRTRVIRPDEEKAILAKLAEHPEWVSYVKAYSFFLFLIDTGSRLNEALGVSWADLDLNRGFMEVYRSKTESLSHVPLSDRLMKDLRKRHNQPKPFMKMDKAVKVLRKVIGEVCNQDTNLCKQRGRATIHSTRDTFTTRMEGKGMSLRKIGKLIGHGSIETTKKYAHLESSALVDEARRLIND